MLSRISASNSGERGVGEIAPAMPHMA